MRLTKARQLLLWTFLLGFIVSVSCLATSFLLGDIYSDELLPGLVLLVGAYSVHLSVIIGGLFAQGKVGTRKIQIGIARSAIAIAAIWNIAISWRFVAFTIMPNDSVDEVTTYIARIAPASAFLVAGVLAFFFATKSG